MAFEIKTAAYSFVGSFGTLSSFISCQTYDKRNGNNIKTIKKNNIIKRVGITRVNISFNSNSISNFKNSVTNCEIIIPINTIDMHKIHNEYDFEIFFTSIQRHLHF